LIDKVRVRVRSIRGRRKEREKEAAAILPAKVTKSPSQIRYAHSKAAKTVFWLNLQEADFSYEINGQVLGKARDSMVDILTEKVRTYLGTHH
jgi:hypothetical protein